MNRPRVTAPTLRVPTHGGAEKSALVMTETLIGAMTLPGQGSFASIVTSLPGSNGPAVVVILDREEVEQHIRLLRGAMDNAERIDRGEPPIPDGEESN